MIIKVLILPTQLPNRKLLIQQLFNCFRRRCSASANATAGKGQGLWQFSFRPYLNITTPAYNIKAGAYTQYHLEPSRRTINLSTSNKRTEDGPSADNCYWSAL